MWMPRAPEDCLLSGPIHALQLTLYRHSLCDKLSRVSSLPLWLFAVARQCLMSQGSMHPDCRHPNPHGWVILANKQCQLWQAVSKHDDHLKDNVQRLAGNISQAPYGLQAGVTHHPQAAQSYAVLMNLVSPSRPDEPVLAAHQQRPQELHAALKA